MGSVLQGTVEVKPKARVLYIAYQAVGDPLLQTQAVSYLRGLAQRGHRIALLTFETMPLSVQEKREWRRKLKTQGIAWQSLRYHNRPSLPATFYDIACGIGIGLKMMRKHKTQIIHARGHHAGVMGAILKRLTRCKLILDFRGFMAEERVDTGLWAPDSALFRGTKRAEAAIMRRADGLVCVTKYLQSALLKNAGLTLADLATRVIPCCADLTRIEAQRPRRDAVRAELKLQDKTVMIYVGKLNEWYLPREMAEFFVAARHIVPQLHFLVLTQSEGALIGQEFERLPIAPADYTITRAKPEDVGAFLQASDFALSLIAPWPSKRGSSPVKIGEYLAAGLPVVSNTGIGDADELLTENGAGVLVEQFADEDYRVAAHAILPMIGDEAVRGRCVNAARAHASLQEVGVPSYDALYHDVLSG